MMDPGQPVAGGSRRNAADDPTGNAQALTEKAERCRRLAAGVSDRQASDVLSRMADSYEQGLAQLLNH